MRDCFKPILMSNFVRMNNQLKLKNVFFSKLLLHFANGADTILQDVRKSCLPQNMKYQYSSCTPTSLITSNDFPDNS